MGKVLELAGQFVFIFSRSDEPLFASRRECAAHRVWFWAETVFIRWCHLADWPASRSGTPDPSSPLSSRQRRTIPS